MSGAKVTLHGPYGRHGALLVLVELQEDAWTLRVGGAAGRTHLYESRRACAALWLLAAMGRLGWRCAGPSSGVSRLAAGCCRCRRRRAGWWWFGKEQRRRRDAVADRPCPFFSLPNTSNGHDEARLSHPWEKQRAFLLFCTVHTTYFAGKKHIIYDR